MSVSARLWCTVGTNTQFAFLTLPFIDVVRLATDFTLRSCANEAAGLIHRATTSGTTHKGHGSFRAWSIGGVGFSGKNLKICHKDIGACAVSETAGGLLAALAIHAHVAHSNRLAFVLTRDDERFDDL